ncbi:MAG: hypothetical protein HY849_03265 [Nitrosomonadales bacterium]|nr:hypothetical protein [Nitrosomonadales bacterium]
MDAWQTILLAFGGNAALLAVLGFAGKSLLEKVIARDTKRFESEIKAQADATVERLKNELQLKTIEHQIRFSRLHEKSAETIAETYSLLRSYLHAVADYVKVLEMAGEKPKAERREAVNTALQEFRSYFVKRQIFLPKETARRVRELDEKLFKSAQHFAMKIEGQETTASSDDWMKAFSSVNEEIPPVLELLEDEFRELLGQAKG